MKIITCASYYGTGSSAVTDLLSEYSSIRSLGRYEYRFAWDPDGLSDLEFDIVQNNNRNCTSYSIDRFIRLVKSFSSFGYADGYKVFGDNLYKLTEQYISNITELKTKSYWYRNRVDKGNLFCYIDRLYSLVRRLPNLKTETQYSLLTNRKTSYFSAISEEDFLKFTQQYTDSLFKTVAKDTDDYLMVDQLVPPTNTERYIRYFKDIKVIIVERDPRDVYLCDQTVWKEFKIPTLHIEDYVKWYKITRRHYYSENEDKTRILRIHFEDLIYKYEETKKNICLFLGVDEADHINPFQYFDPKVSINNSNLKHKIKGFEKEIAFIEDNLKGYLYNFPEP